MLSDAGSTAGIASGSAAGSRQQAERKRAFRRVLPAVEGATLLLALAAPVVLGERTDLITLLTNVLILSLLAISFDLCWGLSGIMSFGQALFFGVAGYVIALVGRDLGFSDLWGTLPLAMIVGYARVRSAIGIRPAGLRGCGKRLPLDTWMAWTPSSSSILASATASAIRLPRFSHGIRASLWSSPLILHCT